MAASLRSIRLRVVAVKSDLLGREACQFWGAIGPPAKEKKQKKMWKQLCSLLKITAWLARGLSDNRR